MKGQGKGRKKNYFEVPISDSNAALDHKDVYDWDLCYQSAWNASRCIASAGGQGQVFKLVVLCWEGVLCTTDQTKPFQRKDLS